MKDAGYTVAPWVEAMIAAGHKTFYKSEQGKTLFMMLQQRNIYPYPVRKRSSFLKTMLIN